MLSVPRAGTTEMMNEEQMTNVPVPQEAGPGMPRGHSRIFPFSHGLSTYIQANVVH